MVDLLLANVAGLGNTTLGRSFVKIASLAPTELLLDRTLLALLGLIAWLLNFALVCLLGLLCVNCWTSFCFALIDWTDCAWLTRSRSSLRSHGPNWTWLRVCSGGLAC